MTTVFFLFYAHNKHDQGLIENSSKYYQASIAPIVFLKIHPICII